MSSLVFPDVGSQLAYYPAAVTLPLTSAAGRTVTIYTDAGGTTLASIFTYPGNVAISGSTLTVDTNSLLPLFYGPVAGTDTLYARLGTGTVVAIYARTDDRIDAIESTATVVKSSAIDTTGVTDSGAAIQAVLNGTGPEFYLPTGTYLTSTTITVPATKKLTLAKGATIRTTGAATGVIVAADATLTGGTVDGTTSTYATQIGGDRAHIDRVTISNATYGCGHAGGYADVTIERCRFFNNASYGCLIENGAARTMVRGNTFLSTTSATQQGVTVKTNTGSPVDTSIVNNVVDVPGVIGLEVQVLGASRAVINSNVIRRATIGISLSGAAGVTVSGNTVVGCSTYGIEAAEGTVDSTISGNTILTCGIGVTISKGASATRPRNITVSGNTIKDSTTYGIDGEFADSVVCSGNLIQNPGDRAILVNNACTGWQITGNRIVRTTVPSVGDGIYLTGTNHAVVGNTVDYSALASAIGYAIYSNGAGQMVWAGNLVFKALKAFAVVGGSLVSIVGNRSEATTEHSVYTSATSGVFVDGHTALLNGGNNVDLTGATSSGFGTVFDPSNFAAAALSGSQRFRATTIGFYSVTPVARAAAITSPTAPGASYVQAEAAAMKTAVDAIRVALTNLGLTS